MSKTKIAVIGAGALGKRHLESILKTALALDVYCVDLNPTALDGFRWEDVNKNKTLTFGTSVEILPEHLDWVLFAMASKGRREMFDAVVARARVKAIVFEKVLFQKEEDYYHVADLLTKQGINAWVNCPRRMQECYRELKQRLAGISQFEIHVTGGCWGLACNAIHMIDMIEFLSGAQETSVDLLALSDHIVDSKRIGYKEVFGSLLGRSGRCTSYSVTCFENSSLPLQIDIVSPMGRVSIQEGNACMTSWWESNGYQEEKRPFKMKFQSQLTQTVLEDIVNSGGCQLTPYEDSMRLHLSFIRPLISFFERNGIKDKVCPIT